MASPEWPLHSWFRGFLGKYFWIFFTPLCKFYYRQPPVSTRRWQGRRWSWSRPTRSGWGRPPACHSSWWGSWRGRWWPSTCPGRWHTGGGWRRWRPTRPRSARDRRRQDQTPRPGSCPMTESRVTPSCGYKKIWITSHHPNMIQNTGIFFMKKNPKH